MEKAIKLNLPNGTQNKVSAKNKKMKLAAKTLVELTTDCKELAAGDWPREIKHRNMLAIEMEAPALIKLENSASVRAEYYSALAELKRISAPPLSAEQLAAHAKHKELLDAKQATASLQVQQSAQLVILGKDLLAAVIGTGEKYLSLCKYIRDNEVAPKLVAADLGQLGFSRQTVSKINRVAGASVELWNEFEARSVGFNKMLQLTRGDKPNEATKLLAESMGQDVVEVSAEVKRLEGEEDQEEKQGEASEKTDDEKDAAADLALKRAAAVIARSRVYFDWKKNKVIKFGDGWMLTVSKDTKWKAPKNSVEGGPKSPTMEAKKA